MMQTCFKGKTLLVSAPESAEWFHFQRNFFFGQGESTSHKDSESNSMVNYQIGFYRQRRKNDSEGLHDRRDFL